MLSEWISRIRINRLKHKINKSTNINFSEKQLTSVVILSMNRADDLKNCIKSLYETTSLPFEVIILDNNSNDQKTIQFLKSICGKAKPDGNGRIKVVYNKKNLGCAGGRRKAIKYAKGKYIATVDNDIIFTSNWLEHLIQRIESNKTIGAACSKLVYPDGRVQLNGGKMFIENNYFVYFKTVQGSKMKEKSNIRWDCPETYKEIECDWLPGGAMLIKRDVAEKVKHDARFLNCFEDYDYSMQIKKLGFRLVNCPKSILIHNHILLDPRKQEKEKDYLKQRWNYQNHFDSLIYFLEKNGLNIIKDSIFYNSELHKQILLRNNYPVIDKRYNELTDIELKTHFSEIMKIRN